MHRRKLKIQLYLQCCILISELGKHEEGLAYSRIAAKKCVSQIMDSMALCYQQLIVIAQNNPKQNVNPNRKSTSSKIDIFQTIERVSLQTLNEAKEVLWNDFYSPKEANFCRALSNKPESPVIKDETMRSFIHQENLFLLNSEDKNKFDYCMKLLPILYEVYKKVEDLRNIFLSPKKEKIVNIQAKNLQQNCQSSKLDFQFDEPDLKLLFQGNDPNHWTNKINILGLLQLKPQSFTYISHQDNLVQLIDIESILLYISYLSVSLYCNSTETRFIDDRKQKQQNLHCVTDSENWLSRSLELVYIFLPHDMPLVAQIISVHGKFHGITKQIIPEDYPVDGNYFVIKTLKGGSKSNFFIPIIRKQLYVIQHEKTEEEFQNQTNQSKKRKIQSGHQHQNNFSKTEKNFTNAIDNHSNTIDYINIHKNKFFCTNQNGIITANINIFTDQNNIQPKSAKNTVNRNNSKIFSSHSSEKRQRKISQNNVSFINMSPQNNSFSVDHKQITQNNSQNNTRQQSPMNQIKKQHDINNYIQPRNKVNNQSPLSQHYKQRTGTLKTNQIEMDQIIGQLNKEKIDVNYQKKQKKLDIQINNNINFFINSEKVEQNFMNDDVIQRPFPPQEQQYQTKYNQYRQQRIQSQQKGSINNKYISQVNQELIYSGSLPKKSVQKQVQRKFKQNQGMQLNAIIVDDIIKIQDDQIFLKDNFISETIN